MKSSSRTIEDAIGSAAAAFASYGSEVHRCGENKGFASIDPFPGEDRPTYDAEVAAAASRLKQRYAYRFVKRTFDIVFSLFVLVCFCWLFAIIAIVVKVDDPKGTVLFGQKRVTKDGCEFTMYKFRSMCADAEERLAELKVLNEKTGPVFKMHDDPRVTRAGRWLRKLSLASIIIGTPGDGESTKSLSRSANSSLDLQLCERRPGLCRIACNHYKRYRFLSVVVFGTLEAFSAMRSPASHHLPLLLHSEAPQRGISPLLFLSISKAVRCNDGGECCREVA